MRVTRLSLSLTTVDQLDVFVSKIIKRLKSGTIEQITKAVSVGFVLPDDALKDHIAARLTQMVIDGKVTHTASTWAIVPALRGRPRIHAVGEPLKVAKAKRAVIKTVPSKRGRKRLFSGLPPVTMYEN
jgi:hypothetical protein